jgi:hypothetical protein
VCPASLWARRAAPHAVTVLLAQAMQRTCCGARGGLAPARPCTCAPALSAPRLPTGSGAPHGRAPNACQSHAGPNPTLTAAGKPLAARHRLVIDFRRLRKRGLRVAIAQLRALLDEAERDPGAPASRPAERGAARSAAPGPARPPGAAEAPPAAPGAGAGAAKGAGGMSGDAGSVSAAVPGMCAQASA